MRNFLNGQAWIGVGLALLLSCSKGAEKAPPLKSLAPAPLAPLTREVAKDGGEAAREGAYRVRASPAWGAEVPKDAARLVLKEGKALVNGKAVPLDSPEMALPKEGPLLLVPDGDTYLVQLAGFFAKVEDAQVEVWLLHPSGQAAFPIELKDEARFGAWLDEPKPGKVRIIQRADGLELQTNIGKLPGEDANGPTVPLRAGQLDIVLLREGLQRLKARFGSDELCLVPSFGTELAKVAQVLSGDFEATEQPIFRRLCLVYPRPGQKVPAGHPGR